MYPYMYRIRQTFEGPAVADIPATVAAELARIDVASVIKPGQTVALTAGSRGVANIATIIKATVQYLQSIGAKPFVIPAMGSHGGGTAEGQLDVLSHYGITEATMGVPLRASMEVVQIGETPDGLPVWLDKYASEADHIGVINRIKPHTDFSGAIESGLMKMMTIGLGKYHGAQHYHRANVQYGYEHVIRTVGRTVLQQARIAFGLGVVENGYDQTAIIRAVLAPQLEETELELQALAKKLVARLPFDFIHLLIVEEMGKNISGAGMDTKVIGRIMNIIEPPPRHPRILRIYVRDLHDDSYGNATGVGLADFVSRRLVNKIDPTATYINCLTGLSPESARIPITVDTDREAVEAALGTIGLVKPEEARIVRIKNTLLLEELDVSEALLAEVKPRDNLEILWGPKPLAFDSTGTLPVFA
ncbi:MAG TPA: lactate racemase domain-containing protein [Alphaproteobacteria bacterium]|nr:lactate racemase domain-containing protein [Alphaproteobacteria bacterium]